MTTAYLLLGNDKSLETPAGLPIGKIFAYKLRRGAPCGHINPIGGFFASGLVFKIPVNRDGETDHRDTGLRVTQFDVLSNAALDHNPI